MKKCFVVLFALLQLFVLVACESGMPPSEVITEETHMTIENVTGETVTAETTEAPETEEVVNDPMAPIAYFSFDELDRGRFVEEKSGARCSSVGTVTQAEGKNGKSAYFDGAGHLTVDIDHPTKNGAHSIAAWIKINTRRVTNESVIAGWGTYKQASDTRLLAYKGELCVSSYGKLATCPFPSDISSQWHHVAMTYSYDTYKLYLDGKLAASCSTGGIAMTDSRVYIGGFGINRLNFYGWIDDMYIFDRAISEA